MLRITKKESIFFTYMCDITEMAHKAALKLENLMTDFTSVDEKIKEISDIEHNCDMLVHESISKLNAAFITPLDREDIFLLIKELDNIVDHIEETAHRFVIFNVKEVKPKAIEFSKTLTSGVFHLKSLINEIQKLKSTQLFKNEIIEINRLENVCDVIYREEIKKLFSSDTHAKDVIRWQGIYEYLEKAIDACEYVANTLEGVVMKHA